MHRSIFRRNVSALMQTSIGAALIFTACAPASAQTLLTQSGDPITKVGGNTPGAESVEHVIDGVAQKYLNFGKEGSGFVVTPNIGASTLTSLRFWTANDAPERDPASFTLEGSNDGGASFSSIVANAALALPDGRTGGGNATLNANTGFFQTVNVAGASVFSTYRLTFPTLKNSGAANSLQIGEVQLFGNLVTPLSLITQPGDAITGVGEDSPAAEAVTHAIDGVGQKYLNFGKANSGFVVTPAFGSSVVRSLRLWTANDDPERDPASLTLEGTNDGGLTFSSIVTNFGLNLPDGRNDGGNAPLDLNGGAFQSVSFANDIAYSAYRVTFPTLKNGGTANSLQIAEVQLFGTAAPASAAPEPGSLSLLGLGAFALAGVALRRRTALTRG